MANNTSLREHQTGLVVANLHVGDPEAWTVMGPIRNQIQHILR